MEWINDMADFFEMVMTSKIVMTSIEIVVCIWALYFAWLWIAAAWRAFHGKPIFKFEETPTDEEIREAIEDTDLFRGLRECERTGVYTGIYRSYDEIVAENKKKAEANRADGCDYCVKCAYCEKYERCTKVKR